METSSPADLAAVAAGATDAQLAAVLVREAGRLAATMRKGGLTARQKTSVSDVVTAADHAAESLVVATLAAHRPDDAVLGEEGAASPGSTGRRWVIDPVDGTYNFFAGSDYWCSALALTDGEGPLLGAVYRPATDSLWIGGRHLPTTENDVPVAGVLYEPLSRCSLGTYIAPDAPDRPEVFEPLRAVLAGVATPRVLGSGSVDLASVASGRLGCWAQHSCPDWDWLPGSALVEAAGGTTRVVTHRGLDWHLAGGARAVDELTERVLAA